MTQEDFKTHLADMLAAADAVRILILAKCKKASAAERPWIEQEATKAAGAEYKLAMPLLTSRRSVQLYIAAVAQGVAHKLLTDIEAKNCLYLAQLALSAFGNINDGPEPVRARAADERF